MLRHLRLCAATLYVVGYIQLVLGNHGGYLAVLAAAALHFLMLLRDDDD